MTQNLGNVNNVVNKLTSQVITYEYILSELKKNLQDRNIRKVYR
jgi:hypothetical protein